MRVINIVIVDDEPNAVRLLENYFKQYFREEVNILGSFTDTARAFSFISTTSNIDLLVLDINMPDINGVELLKAFPNRDFEGVFIQAGRKRGG